MIVVEEMEHHNTEDKKEYELEIIKGEHQESVFKDFKIEDSHSYRALFFKNASLQKRRKVTNCCQLFVPVAIVILIGVINILLRNAFGGDDITGTVHEGQVNPISVMNGRFPYLYYVNNTNGFDLGSLPQDENTTSGFLGLFPFRTDFETHLNSPFFIESTKSAFDEHLIALKKKLIEEEKQRQRGGADNSNDPPTTENTLPVGAIVFSKVDLANVAAEVEIMYESQQDFSQVYPLGSAIGAVLGGVNSALLRSAIDPTFSLQAFMQYLPYREVSQNIDVSSFIAQVLFPFAFSFLLPVYVHGVVSEKQERLIEMMKMNGLSMMSYWIINFVYNLLLFAVVTFLLIVIALIFQLPFFKDTNGLITFLVFLGWGLNQVSKGFLLSTFFSKARTASIVCYLLVVFSILSSNVVNNVVYQDEAPWAYFLWPPFGFYRAIFIIGARCGIGLCPQLSDMKPGSELSSILVILYIEAFVFAVLTLYFDQVLPQEFGVRKSPFFIFNWLVKRKKDGYEKFESHLTKEEDPDVAAERKRVDTLADNQVNEHPVVIRNLHKRYDDKIAVEDLCLILDAGECFGLLGPNGAGKTTTISMLTGLFMPTSGTGFVGGYDIRYEMDEVHKIIGICPQFDILWDTLTVRETLLFYSRLKGARKADEKEMAMNTITQVGLEQFADLQVKELSGGMKRRLSVAVSMVGNPKIIFMDEPSTGLDPETRRSLWNVLLQVKQGKCLIITTHSMEEADTLCTRIGIMSKGNLRCLGSNVRLKNKFGEGYSLKINFNAEDKAIATAAINKMAPNATLEESFAGNHTYRIPSKGFVMSELLSQMIEHKDEAKIMDWGVTQTTLEDVFLNIVRQDES